MQASIITVGDEILIGQVIDSNSAWLGQQLSEIGISVKKIWSVADESDQIILGMKQALEETDILFMTGGLGPTKDDITKKAIADFLGRDMYFDEPTFERIKSIFEKLGRSMSPSHHDQCLMPNGVEILYNSMGTAPGMLFRHDGKIIISMPGVPYEMKAIMSEIVLPMIKSTSSIKICHKTILTACTGETTIENMISDIVTSMPSYIKVAYLPAIASVRLRLSGTGSNETELNDEIQHYTQLISQKLGDIVYGYDDSSLEQEILTLAIQKDLKISTAESCTGGAIASRLVTVPGSSAYYMGSIVAYDNAVKQNLLQVPEETISRYGAVSEETVKAMVIGANHALQSDVSIGVTGIAGPDGGTPEKPVGHIWICVGNKDIQETFLLKAGKNRLKNIETTTFYALDMLRKFILKEY